MQLDFKIRHQNNANMKKKILFIDRDGTLIIEPESDQQVDSLEKLTFYPGVFRWLSQIATELEYELVMVTNQDGLGTDAFPESSFWPAHNKMLKAFQNEGIEFAAIHIDRSFPAENSPFRKPGKAMLSRYFNDAVDLRHSFVIGDRLTDIDLAENLGAKGILLSEKTSEKAVLSTAHWEEIYRFLKKHSRKAVVLRETAETQIRVELNLDGIGRASIKTGLGFFDHMLEQLARHGGLDLLIDAKADLYVDEHHAVEDVALALGSAFREALGQKKGIARYGFLLPMDDCLAQLAIDFGGRPWLVWDVDFKRERIGDVPTEMWMHFFKSFSDEARCNLNIKAEGFNEHHKIEAVFKAFARAIGMAVQQTGQSQVPSTKGVL